MVFLYPLIMRTDFIPFKIGMEYENWEFDLEPIENTLEYDKYLYFKNDITSVFGFEVSKIFLYFSWDILVKVEIYIFAKTLGEKSKIPEKFIVQRVDANTITLSLGQT